MPEYSTPKVTPTETTKIPGMNGNSSGYIDAKDLLDIIRATFGQANGVATLGPDGKLTSSQLPDLADDVLVYGSYALLPNPGIAGKLYITADNNKMYRWDDALATPAYVELSVDLSAYATKAELAAEESAREAEDTNLKNAIENTTIWDIDQEAEVTFEGDGAGTWEIMERQIPTEPNDGIFLCMDSSAPSSSSSTGLKGQFYMDANYLYLCIANNTWRRVALSTF